MPLDIVTVPCRSDNYAYLLHGDGETALVDAPESGPILETLRARGWELTEIWITHHHVDHVDGLAALREAFPDVSVIGSDRDSTRLPPLTKRVVETDHFTFAGHDVEVIEVSGHTVGHIAFHLPKARAVFTADSLMALGCGRLFEGTPEMMWRSLQKLMALPDETLVYSGHEYTQANARFALSIEPDNADLQRRAKEIDRLRAEDTPTVPARLDVEKATNPFLRAHLPEIKRAIDMEGADDAEVFAQIRSRKDSF